jgi:hypothetical protein
VSDLRVIHVDFDEMLAVRRNGSEPRATHPQVAGWMKLDPFADFKVDGTGAFVVFHVFLLFEVGFTTPLPPPAEADGGESG